MPALIERRDLLKIASAALIGLATGRRNWAMPTELVQNVGQAAHWVPVFFNPHQNESVMLFTDLIIPRTDTPGAKEANVVRYLDLFLSIKSPAEQKQFVDGLTWLDSYTNQTYKHDFSRCSGAEQTATLSRMARPVPGNTPEIDQAFFNQLKTMTSSIYYSTGEGYKELNKFGPPPSIAECEDAASHV